MRQATPATPRRRWFRFAFSLQTLFVVVTVFAIPPLRLGGATAPEVYQ